MSQDHSFDDLMARLRKGDDEVATRIFNRFGHQLIALARSRLGPQLRQKIDPEDVTQSVFRSFFAHQAAGELEYLRDWEGLWGMLVAFTLRKCGHRVEYFHAACRDVQREVSRHRPADQSGADWEGYTSEPTPTEAAMLTEMIEQVMSRLEGRQRQILTLCLQGVRVSEISAEVGCTERTVYRVLDRVKEMIQTQGSDDKANA